MTDKTIFSVLPAALASIGAASKNKANPAFKGTKYADLGSVLDAIRPITEHGLWFRQVSHEVERGVSVETLYVHATGELSAGRVFVPASKADAQGYGSAQTYARRYGLQLAFGLATEDDDGNSAAASVRGEGQSKEGAVSPHPDRKTKLDGPIDTLPKLETAIKGFVRDMGTIAAADEWWLFKNANADLLAQAERDHPEWWGGWPEQPDGFTPLKRKIELFEATLCGEETESEQV